MRGAPISPMNPDGAKFGYRNAADVARVEGVADHQFPRQESSRHGEAQVHQRIGPLCKRVLVVVLKGAIEHRVRASKNGAGPTTRDHGRRCSRVPGLLGILLPSTSTPLEMLPRRSGRWV